MIASSTPASGEGISASTLSVEISKSGSSLSTRVADLLDPADDRAFRDRLAHLGHHDISGHKASPFNRLRYESHVAVTAMRGLADRFRHRRVRVDGADQLFDRGLEPQRHGGFGRRAPSRAGR